MWSLQWGDPTQTTVDPDDENKIWPGRWAPGCTIDEDDRVWLFGGYGNTSPTNWNDMWSFDTKTVTWTVERESNSSMLPGNVISFGTFDINNYPCQRDSVNMIDRRDGSIMLFGGRNSDLVSLWTMFGCSTRQASFGKSLLEVQTMARKYYTSTASIVAQALS